MSTAPETPKPPRVSSRLWYKVPGLKKLVQDQLYNRPKERLHCKYGMPAFYAYYKEHTIPELRVSHTKYCEILDDVNKRIVDYILQGEEVKLPCGCGRLLIHKQKMWYGDSNRLRIDWARTKATGAKCYHLNEHRDGHIYRWHWNKLSIRNPNAVIYSFIPCRKAKRTLAAILKSDASVDYTPSKNMTARTQEYVKLERKIAKLGPITLESLTNPNPSTTPPTHDS